MMLVCASMAGAGVGNFGSEGSGTGWARAGSARNAPAIRDNVSLFFILLPLSRTSNLLGIIPPQPFQRRRQGLHHHPIVDMARAHGEDIAVIIALLLEHIRHPVVGQRPIVPSLFGIIEAVVLFA